MVSLGFQPGTTGRKLQPNPLIYGATNIDFWIARHLLKSDTPLQVEYSTR